jgi:trk system potassium uptake protein TrkH
MLYHRVYKGRWRGSIDLLQFRSLLILAFLITIGVGLCMFASGVTWSKLIRNGPFLAFSAQTTAGFSTMDISNLDGGSKLVLMLAMVIGGGVGSTAGGFKILRLLVLIQILNLMVVRTCLASRAVSQPHIAGTRLNEEQVRDALLIIILFTGVIIVSWLPFLILGYDPLDALFEVVSATGTVGLSTGISRQALPTFLKGILCVDMLMGRLEIMVWIVFFSSKTWIGRRLRQQ